MRSDQEVRWAIALFGLSFDDPALRQFIWGSHEVEAGQAKAMLHTLFWVVGTDASDFSVELAYVELKLREYEAMEKSHAD